MSGMEFLSPTLIHQYVTIGAAGISLLMTIIYRQNAQLIGCALCMWFFIYLNISCLVGSTPCPTWGWFVIALPVLCTFLSMFMPKSGFQIGADEKVDDKEKLHNKKKACGA